MENKTHMFIWIILSIGWVVGAGVWITNELHYFLLDPFADISARYLLEASIILLVGGLLALYNKEITKAFYKPLDE